jgi:uncharacterized protein
MQGDLQFDQQRLREICRSFHVRRLAVFGSAVRGELRPDSDIDVLIEFAPDQRPGMVGMHQLEQDLSGLFGNRRIDLVNPKYLNPRIRDRVLGEAEVQYAEG